MPYYNDPSSDIQQGMQGSFNPMTGRLNGGNMVLEFLARMAGQKEKAKQDQWAVEDRDLDKRYKEAQISNLGETTQRNPTSLQERIALLIGNPELYDRVFPKTSGPKTPEQIESEAAARARGTASVSGPKAADESERKDLVEQRRSAAASAKERKKNYDAAMTEIGAIEKQISATKLGMIKAQNNGDGQSMAVFQQTLSQLQIKKDILDGTLENIVNSFSPGAETIPPDVLAKAKMARPDLSDEEIIKAWQARKK